MIVTAKEVYLLSRPTKCRRVCRFPEILEFSTIRETLGEPVILTVDKYETIRLLDKDLSAGFPYENSVAGEKSDIGALRR